MYQPVSFRFRIKFEGLDDPDMTDSHFQSISGLEAIIDKNMPNVSDTFAPSSLVLKRAAKNPTSSPLNRWLFSHLNQHQNVSELPGATIDLLDDTGTPYMAWTIKGIIPVSWKLSELNAEKSEVLMETIELSYKSIFYTQCS